MQTTQKLNPLDTYTPEDHIHRFASWAAGRAASVKNCRFTVQQAQKWITQVGLSDFLVQQEDYLTTKSMDGLHRVWRSSLISVAANDSVKLTHGVAAKLINVYFKAAFVSSTAVSQRWINELHPPIDAILLDALHDQNVGGLGDFWKKSKLIRWSNFDCEYYEKVIENIKSALGDRPLWQIEAFWCGHQ